MLLSTAETPLIVAGLVALIAGATDLWRFKVYNVLTLPTLALGLVAATVLGGWPGLRLALLGAGLGFSVLLVLHALGGVGAGDVKLLTALGAWLGPDWLVRIFAASALATGAYGLALVAWHRGFSGVAAELILVQHTLTHPGSLTRGQNTDVADEVARPDRRRRLVPFAAMTFVGFVVVLLGHFGPPRATTPMVPLASAGSSSWTRATESRPAALVTQLDRLSCNPEPCR